jgi:hypothetical protein
MKPLFQFLSADPHAFATLEDIEEASQIEAAIKDLEEQFQSLHVDGLIKRFSQAREKYLAAPTVENLAEAKKAVIEEKTFRTETKIRSLAKSALNDIYSKRAIPLGKRIIERALSVAKERLDKVRSDERARMLKLGVEMTRSSIVDSALVPVSQLERLLSQSDGATASMIYRPGRILKLFVDNTGLNGSSDIGSKVPAGSSPEPVKEKTPPPRREKNTRELERERRIAGQRDDGLPAVVGRFLIAPK